MCGQVSTPPHLPPVGLEACRRVGRVGIVCLLVFSPWLSVSIKRVRPAQPQRAAERGVDVPPPKARDGVAITQHLEVYCAQPLLPSSPTSDCHIVEAAQDAHSHRAELRRRMEPLPGADRPEGLDPLARRARDGGCVPGQARRRRPVPRRSCLTEPTSATHTTNPDTRPGSSSPVTSWPLEPRLPPFGSPADGGGTAADIGLGQRVTGRPGMASS